MIHSVILRRFLVCCIGCLASGSSGPGAVAQTSLSDPGIRYDVADRHYVVLQRAGIRAVVVDNAAVDDDVLKGHRAGYHGLASLSYERQPGNLFVEQYAGLNFEHIHDGRTLARERLFEPRHASMELRQIDPFTVELHQPATPDWKLESCHRYALLPDGTIELTIELIPRADTFARDYIGLFWASYIHQPESLDIHFRGLPDAASDTPRWIRGVTPQHGVRASHRKRGDDRDFGHDQDFPLTLVFNDSPHRYTDDWYYGVSHGMAWVVMFRPQDGIRFAQSPSGGGEGNPAWDFQAFISPCQVGRVYRFVVRAMYVPFESAEQLDQQSREHRAALAAQD